MDQARYSRLLPLERFSQKTMEKISRLAVAIAGTGTLGSWIASLVVSLGFGRVILIDRDIVTIENLASNPFFWENDLKKRTYKVHALAQKLGHVNSAVQIETKTLHLDYKNAEEVLSDAEIILDGLDNFRARFIVNEVAIKQGKPYFYGGVAGEEGIVMPVVSGKGPCLRCLLPKLPLPGEVSTCAEIGMDPFVVQAVAAMEVSMLIDFVSKSENFEPMLCRFEARNLRSSFVKNLEQDSDCPVCAKGKFPMLSGLEDSTIEALCGANLVQMLLPVDSIELDRLATTLSRAGFEVRMNPYFLRATREGIEFTIFPQGKVIMKGSEDTFKLEAFVHSYIGG